MNDFYTGLTFLLMALGIGGCNYLSDRGDVERHKAGLEYKIESEKILNEKCAGKTEGVFNDAN